MAQTTRRRSMVAGGDQRISDTLGGEDGLLIDLISILIKPNS
jgi:hypothetical protein